MPCCKQRFVWSGKVVAGLDGPLAYIQENSFEYSSPNVWCGLITAVFADSLSFVDVRSFPVGTWTLFYFAWVDSEDFFFGGGAVSHGSCAFNSCMMKSRSWTDEALCSTGQAIFPAKLHLCRISWRHRSLDGGKLATLGDVETLHSSLPFFFLSW